MREAGSKQSRNVIRVLYAILLLCVVALPAARAQTVEVIPPSGQWVTDRGDMLSASEEQALTQKLRSYADTTSTQMIIVTLPDLGGADISMYATELGQQWQVGQQDKDNGLVILVSRDDRKVFIATGFGLEGAIPDAIAGRIIRNIITPNFRQGRIFQGLSDAVDALMLAAAGEYTADEAESYERSDDDGTGTATLFVIMIIIYFVITSIRKGGGKGGGRRYRSRGGPPVIIWGGGGGFGGGGGSFGGGFGGGGGGFGGGGAGGGW